MDVHTRLTELKQSIQAAKEPKTESVRTVLSWFGYQRRGSHVLGEMERALTEAGLQTNPDLSEPWIDGEVEISLASSDQPDARRYEALIPRLRHLDAANQTPVSVSRDQTLSVAISLMLHHDFSQLPVMNGQRNINGVISWRSIGEAIGLGGNPEHVRDCMDSNVRILHPGIPLTEAIDEIAKHGFVMVRSAQNIILGPVTTTDLAGQYHALAEPFLLISQIESSIRRILDRYAPLDVLQDAKFGDESDARKIQGPDDLNFSEYKTALAHDTVWNKLATNLDKSVFLDTLEKVRVARNDVMHFHPDDNSETTLKVLRDAARAFEKIARATLDRP